MGRGVRCATPGALSCMHVSRHMLMCVRVCIPTQLKLRSNKLAAEAVECICEGLSGSASIKALDLGANALGAEGIKALAKGGAFASSLTQARTACASLVSHSA